MMHSGSIYSLWILNRLKVGAIIVVICNMLQLCSVRHPGAYQVLGTSSAFPAALVIDTNTYGICTLCVEEEIV